MPTSIRLKTKRRGRSGPRLLLFSVAFVSTFVLALAYWYGADQLIAIVEEVRAKVISGGHVKLGIDLVPPAKPEPEPTTTVPTKIPSRTIQVVDGDTIRTNGLRYRLVGFDAPETIDAKCPKERVLGERATARLKAIVTVSRHSLQLTEVRCSCPPGTEGTQSCNFGRRCGLLKANGEDVGQILIREGLARPYVCGSYGCPKRQPWC
jgi:endonuclease YncB( thermonuclease family)